MICVAVDSNGVLYAVEPQPVSVIECGLVVSSGAAAVASPFHLTVEEGAQIGFAVLLIWALAYGFRLLARVGNFNDNDGGS